MSKCAVGVDFGTESGRPILVDVADGRQLATTVYTYENRTIDERLPLPDRGGVELRRGPGTVNSPLSTV
jgi:ribulose kinase